MRTLVPGGCAQAVVALDGSSVSGFDDRYLEVAGVAGRVDMTRSAMDKQSIGGRGYYPFGSERKVILCLREGCVNHEGHSCCLSFVDVLTDEECHPREYLAQW